MARAKYNDHHFEIMVEMREQGKSVGQIALKLDMSASSVSWHCLRLGADSPKTSTKVPKRVGPMTAIRNGKIVRRFTQAEDQTLLELESQGKTLSEIARSLGRKRNSILGRLMTLARRDQRIENAREAAYA